MGGMALDCGATAVKYCLCLFNFVLFLGGATVLSVGIWLAADKESFVTLIRPIDNPTLDQFTQPNVIEQGAYILIAVGALIFILGFLGCCGALKESKLLLSLYGIFLLIVLALEITVIVLAIVYQDETQTHAKSFLVQTLKEWYTTPKLANVITISWNYFMAEVSCCGVYNYTDFRTAVEWQKHKESGQQMPIACCVLKNLEINNATKDFTPMEPNCVSNPTSSNSYYMTGCYRSVYNEMMTHKDLVIGVTAAVCAIELIGIVFAFCLCRSIKSHFK